MKYRYILLIAGILLLIPSFTVKAQVAALEKANVDFYGLKYSDAAKKYLTLANNGNNSLEVLKNLGDIYYLNSDYVQSRKWYDALYTKYAGQIDYIALLRYAQSLLATGNNSKAAIIYDKFLKTKGGLSHTYKSAQEYIENIDTHSDRYIIESLPINSNGIDFGGFLYDGNFYFSSNKNDVNNNDIDAWTDSNFLDISIVDYNETENKFGKVKVLGGKLRTKFHDSSPIITKDGNTMYFTRTSVSLNKKNKGKGIDRLKIYRASKINGKWDDIKDLSINGESFSNAHPSLSYDEKKLYFASDMPGTFGETDIFYVDVHPDGSLGKPQNLGPQVNTVGRESFPFISSENELYFSSDGHFGFGGLDIYYIDLSIENKKLFNIGAPVNGPTDDFSFRINNNTNKGFFSSNRNNGDDIYGVIQKQSVKDALYHTVTGTIVDASTKQVLSSVILKVKDTDGNIIEQSESNQRGEFTFTLSTIKGVSITAEKKEYDNVNVSVPPSDNGILNISMSRIKIDYDEKNDLAKILKLKNIYFNFNSAVLRYDASVELDKIFLIMKNTPEIKIEVRAHTDNIGQYDYNMKLSNQRAKSTTSYLVKKGINPNRLHAKGFGESQPIYDCKVCTNEQNKRSRRSEFIIIRD
ncbi:MULTISPECIES: OmpA family protein [Flavobacterium]|uniref:OmpA family protein n=1 Tax=Flavobacterium TaxID=237 RepID=UPI002114826D|nr:MULTISPECIES: OmpA family protein [Flavobacterium]UUF12409.1 OmpA family protein [Flavobacterium panici]